MSDITPEQARAAAEVIARYVLATDPIEHKHVDRVGVSANMLLNYAAELELAQVEKAKRDKRIEELAREVLDAAGNPYSLVAPWERRVAVFLLDRYPPLLDEGGGQ